jgi:putative phosphoribosyl transferase
VLHVVQCPTLLIVGGDDTVVLRLNEEAASRLRCEHRIAVVRGATHLFEEPGTLETAADLARDWFLRNLGPTE